MDYLRLIPIFNLFKALQKQISRKRGSISLEWKFDDVEEAVAVSDTNLIKDEQWQMQQCY